MWRSNQKLHTLSDELVTHVGHSLTSTALLRRLLGGDLSQLSNH